MGCFIQIGRGGGCLLAEKADVAHPVPLVSAREILSKAGTDSALFLHSIN